MNMYQPLPNDYLDLIYVLDDKFHTKLLIDTYISFVWTERYRGYGDFELVLPVDERIIQIVNLDDYLTIRESDKLMIIETMTLNVSDEDGDTITLSGRSLEAYLTRRIVWYKVNGKMTPAALIKRLMNENAVAPVLTNRVLTGLKYEEPTDKAITDLEVEEYEIAIGDGLYDTLDSVCNDHNLGFRIDHGEEGEMIFRLYFGTDRSWSQNENTAVVFSASYENLVSSNFIQSEVDYASNALVTGSIKSGDNSIEKVMEIYRKPERMNLKRREIFIQVSDSELANTDAMFTKAKEVMRDYNVTVAFGSDVDPFVQFEFGKDYFVGDIVQVQDRYGFEGRCRVEEVVRSRDAAGFVLTPTFVSVDENDVEVK